jgi:hypothetical protein
VGVHRPLRQRSLKAALRAGQRHRFNGQVQPGLRQGRCLDQDLARAPTLKTTSSELPSGRLSTFLSSSRMWAITCSINEYSCNFANTSLYGMRSLQESHVCIIPVSNNTFTPGKRNILPPLPLARPGTGPNRCLAKPGAPPL